MNIPAQYITYVSCIAISQCDFLLQWHILLSILASTLSWLYMLYTYWHNLATMKLFQI